MPDAKLIFIADLIVDFAHYIFAPIQAQCPGDGLVKAKNKVLKFEGWIAVEQDAPIDETRTPGGRKCRAQHPFIR